MDPGILLYRPQLDDNEFHLLSNPPCKLYSRITEFISANPNNVDYIGITKSPNSFFFYRKNYIAKHKSSRSKKDGKILSKEAGDAWNNESDEVKSYFKALAKLAREKNKSTYDKKGNISVSSSSYSCSTFSSTFNNTTSLHFVDKQSELQLQQKDPYTSNSTNSPRFMTQQPEPQRKQKDNLHKNNNNDYAHSLFFPYPTFSCTNDNTTSLHFMAQLQEDNFYNDRVVSLSSFCPYSTFFCTSDNTSSPHFMSQQLQQKDNLHKNNNNDRAVSSSSIYPYPICPYTSNSTSSPHFMTQQLEPLRKQKDNLYKNNNNYCAHSLSYSYPTFSRTNDNTTSLHFMFQQPEPQQNLKENNNDYAVSSSSPHSLSTFSCTIDVANSSHL
ncbi:5448_t:CDS:2 [Entrophospora sp. SA101]|nr:9380_t:CDS:2 [Entrophospora sp. SA101]CAJ0626961.1 5448_t:CDS:2 [Entrophospora sp. SA101]CAJ0858916.1 5491_t:CDS:2 [Entrophospora sp. SA101]CAJ0859013.1 13226_t:CDS:2 [Entrophospora sp. SA101]CAJ0915008.1 6352_t:CDS:2 [Entrophospora sp. SA101]